MTSQVGGRGRRKGRILRQLDRGAIAATAMLLFACGAPQLPSYGNFGGPMRPQEQPQYPSTPEGELIGAEHQVRWYPRSARFSPDESHLLVSLCHFRFSHYCRVARYWVAESRWEVLPHDVGVSAAWPDYSPDGQRIVYAQQRCEATFQCGDLGFKLATMNRDGQERRELGPVGVQMPTWSPDAKRLLYWRLNGVGRLASGRTIGSFDVYEFSLGAAVTALLAETRITAESYFGTYTAPRYLSDGEHFLYSAEANDASASRAFVVGRDEAMRIGRSSPRKSIPVWDGRTSIVLHSFHPLHGWLAGYFQIAFMSSGKDGTERVVFDASPFHVGMADVARSGKQLVVLSGSPLGTAESGGAVSYWKQVRTPKPPVPVMALIDADTGSVHPVTDWPSDVERVTQPRARPSARLSATQ